MPTPIGDLNCEPDAGREADSIITLSHKVRPALPRAFMFMNEGFRLRETNPHRRILP